MDQQKIVWKDFRAQRAQQLDDRMREYALRKAIQELVANHEVEFNEILHKHIIQFVARGINDFKPTVDN